MDSEWDSYNIALFKFVLSKCSVLLVLYRDIPEARITGDYVLKKEKHENWAWEKLELFLIAITKKSLEQFIVIMQVSLGKVDGRWKIATI